MTLFSTRHAVPAGAALACLLLATITLAGWWLHSFALIGAAPGSPQMFAVTATGFVCAAFAILAQLHPARLLAAVARLAALGVCAIGLGSLALRLAGWAPAALPRALGHAPRLQPLGDVRMALGQ